MSPAALIMAAVFFVPGAGSYNSLQRNSLPFKFRCEQVVENGETFLMCDRYDPDRSLPLGPKPAYHCSFTVYSHVQRGFCSDGKGSWPSELRGSGAHPREMKRMGR